MADTFDVPLKAWTGAPGRSFIQGLNWEPVTSQWFVAQADDVSGQSEQDTVIRRHASDRTYLDSSTVKRAGHGSTTGVQWTEEGVRIWLGHATLGAGYFIYGNPGGFVKTPGIPNGDIAVAPQHDLLCVRTSNRYRIYRLSSVDGTAELLCDDTITDWYNRFQGHRITRLADGSITLLVHRDVATRKASEARWYTVSGGKLTHDKATQRLDTTAMSWEAEGFTEYDGSIWVTKRMGDTGPSRVVRCTRTKLVTAAPTLKPLVIMGKRYDPIDSVSVAWVNDARTSGKFSRHVYYVQVWLNRVLPSLDPLVEDGYWGPATQSSYDAYRRSVLKLTGEDALGEVGFTSLSKLNDAAHAGIAVREEK
jgi:hypothetical protein